MSSGIYAQDNAVLNIDVASGKKLEMRDALTGGSSVDVTKKGAGNWMLSGASSFTGGTKFLVEEGILALDHQASIILASGGKESIFSLGKSGQNTTLLAHGDNKIETHGGKIVLDAGSDENTSTTFSFKVTDKNQIATKDDANKDNAVLSLDGSLLLDGNNQFNVDVDLSDIKSGNSGLSYYSLLYSMQGGMVADRFKLSKNLTYQGENISNIDRLAGLSLLFSDDQKSIVLQNGQDSSKILTAIASWKGDGSIWKSVGNWSTVDSDGKKADRSIFISGDFADFSLADNTPQTIILDPETGTIDTAGIYVSGNTDYLFDGDGLNTSKHQTTFKDHFGNPLESDGKLILGQKVVLDETTGFLVAQGQDEGVNFTGTVDLTQTAKNSFEGGVDIYGGTLKISHEDQLGVTSLHDLTLAGSQDNHATLLVADGGDVMFEKQTLTIARDKFATIQNEGTGKLTFRNHVTGGTAVYNYGSLVILGAAKDNLIHFNGENNHGNQTIINQGDLTISNVKFTGHGSYIPGNLGIEHLAGNVEIEDTIFEDYYYAIDSKHQDAVVTLKNVDFNNNSRRAIDLTAGTVNVEGGIFTNNGSSNTNHGGAIYSYDRVNVTGNTLFTDNQVSQNGAALANTGTMNVDGARFEMNKAGRSGGAVLNYILNSGDLAQMQIANAIFTNNTANQHGGAIYTESGSTTTITDTDFIGNTATTGKGGAIYNAGILNLNVSDNGSSIFEGNSASGDSSALYLADGSSLNMNIGQDGLLDMQDQFSGENTTVTKNGLGTWKLAGDNALTGSSSVIFNEGIVEFTKGSGVRLDDELFGFGGSVTFGNANTDTRIIINGRNTITANSALFNTGVNGSTTFEFNLDDSNYSRTDTPADYAKLAALKVSFDRISQGDIRQGVQFEINDTDSLDSGFYTLYYNMSYNHLDSLFKDTIADFNSRHNQDRNNLMTLHDKMGTILLEKGMIYRGIARWTGLESLWDSKGSFAVTDAKGRIWDQFAANDYAIFGLTDGSNQWVNLNDTMQTAGIYVSGDSNYHFEGTGLAANKVDMSDFTNGLMSQGKLVLGQVFDDQLAISDQAFTGIVDLTDTDHNSFVGGVDVYSGTLKVATKDQLGTSLNQLNLSGSKDNTATLAIAKDADLTFNNETLTVTSGKFAALDLESDATVTFTGNQNGWDINGGTLTLNTAAGAILDIQNMIYSSGGEINKVGEGSFKLAGNQQFVNHSKVNIQEGIFELAEDATLDLEGSNSLFIMGSEGKHSTFIASGNNTIKVGGTNNNIIFNSGDDQGTSTTLKLKVDATNGISTIGDASAQNAVLTFAGNVQITGSNGVNIDLFGLSSGATGLYTLLYTTGTTAFNQADFSLNQNITFQGRAISDIARLSGMGLIVEDNAVILDKGGTILTSVATWTGAEGNLIWDGVSENWNVTDSSGKLWNTFMNGDFVNFAALAANGTQNMTIRDAVESAGVYVSGDTSYLFSGEGITTKALATTFNPHNISDGKFVLGQQVLIENSGKELNVLDEAFTGLVDLTGITGKNRFEGGIDIFGGTLRVASKDQLGTTLDNILLAGTKINTATLAIKEGSHIAFTNETLTVGNDHDATLNLEQDAEVIFNSNGNAGKGLEINGGSLALNTAAGAILDFHNQISGNDATLTKAGLGTLKLAGNNHFTGKSNVSFLEGTVNLADKSNLELQGAGSLLTLGGNGKTTRIVANGHNTLNVNGDLVLNNSVDLTFAFNVTKDNYSATQAGIGSSIAVLNLEVDKIILSNAANAGGIQVDLLGSNLAGLDQGYYTLLNSNAELKEGLFDSNIKGHTNQDRFNTLFLAQDKNRLVLEKDIVYSGIANWLGGSQWANAGSNWSATDSKGRTWKEFANNDYANFGLVGATQTIDLGLDTVNTAGLYFNGDATYTFTGKGLNTAILETTFGANSNEMSLGKLVLGQNIVANGSSANITDKTFSGVVDLTGTAANHFEGGIDIYGGTLRVANEKQLGTTLDDLTLAGNSADNVATLQLASNGKLNLKDQTLTIDSGFAKLDLEKDAQMSLAGTNAGIALNGGTLMLNTTLGSIFDLNQMTGNGANDATFNKTGQGTLKLAGHNTFAGKTGFNILEGVFNLAENGSINLQGQGSSLTLGSSGKNTTFVINGKNSLNVNGDIVFQGGGANGNTILSFNVTDANYITALSQAGSGNAALTLGDFEVKDGPIKIDIAGISSSHDSGLYTLLYTTGMFKEGDFNLKNPLTYQGQNITDIARLKELSLLMKEDAIVLNKGKLYTGVATWKGGAVWDSVSNNWNVKDSSGQSWNTFMSSDFVNFAANGKQSIRIGEDLHGADIFFQGNGEYLFSEKGLAAKVITSTFEPGKVSTGKLVLGQSISHDLTISDSAFTGIVDLTKTIANSFEGGIDIYGGTLRILGEKQLGTTLDKLNLAGSSSNLATLAIAEKGSLQLEDQTLTIADGKYGALNLEKDAIVTLANSAANANGQQGLVINGGNFVLNTALGAIFDLQNGLAGTHGDFTKLGEGSFKLAGQNSLAGTSHFNIVEGTMDLAKAGELTLEGAGSSFTLGAEGKRVTLVANGKNAINVNGDVILNTGKKLAEGSKDPVTDTSLSFNLTDDNHIATIGDASKDNAALYLGGTLKIEGDNRVNININSLKSSHNEGLYTLLFTANQLDANKFNLQHNLTYQGRAVADIARLKHITLVVDDNVIALDKGTLYTGVATWKDPADAKDAVWDSVSENWTVLDSNGGKWNTFLEGDVVNFASEKSQSISLKEAIVAADIFVSGKANYTFNGEGITIKKLATTFDPATTGMSSGKLVLGQIMNDQFLVDGTAQGIEYSGRVDLTGTQKNSFEGGIDIYGGTLRIATNDQLGTSLDNVSLLGQSNGSIATLAVKSDSDLHFIDETLTVSNGHYGRLQLERDAKVTFEGGSDVTDPNYKAHGINIDGGLLTLNTATGSVIDMKNGLTGHDATLNKIGSGSLKLQGDTNLTGTSRVNIQEGLVDLANNGSFTLNGAGSSFTLGSTGRHTSLHLAGNNSIDVEGDILLNTGGKNGSTTLAFDVKDENRFDINKGETASKDNAVLNINASGDLKTSSEGKITIDIASLASNQAGLYTLLYTQNFLDPSKFSASLSYKGRATANIERLNVLDIEVGDHSIVLNQGVIYNGNAVWTGALADSNGMAIWDVAEKNWKVTDSAGKTWETFIDRDSVVFGDLPGKNQNIKIQAGATGHLVESMLVNSQYDYHFSGDQITMENGLVKDGKGSLIFNNSGLTGDLILNEGMLVIGGGKSALDVKGDVTANKGTLAGFATIDGDVLIGKGATLSPGYGNQPNATAFGTLTAHSFNFKEGSTFVVDADEKGNHDKIIASIKNGGSGIVSIEKDVAMDVRAGAGSWHAGQSVVVVEADTEVDGSFDKLTTNLDFLDASLDYSQKDQVTLNLKRNDNSFNSVGLTYNGRAVAGALDGLSNDHAVSKAFQGMTFAEAAKSFDNISGEIYASTQKAIFQSSRALGQKMQSRLALRESEATIGGMNPEGKDAFWMEALGYDGTVKSDNNAAKMERKGGGLLIGYDRLISTSHNFTLGVAGGYEDMKLKLKDTRDSESKVKSVHLMTYMGTDLGDSGFNLKAGLNYSYLRYNTDRNININSIAGVAKSKHKGHQYQVFAEVSRMFDVPEFNNMQMTPYVGVAHTEVKSNSFRESGSLAALEANRQSNQQTSAVIGVRNNWFFGEQNEFALRTDLGWQYEFGNEYQDYDLRFVGAGPSYNIRSTTNGRSSALIGVGFTGKHDNLEFNVGYQGQFGSKVQDHAINANLIWWLKYDDNGRNLE